MKLLIAGTSHVKNDLGLYLCHEWMRMARRLNGDHVDLVLVDSFNPNNLAWEPTHGVERIQFPDDIGHLVSTGKDSWGRATMRALQYAIDGNYDMVATYDYDIMFTYSIAYHAQKMWDLGIKAASTWAYPYSWLEGIFIFNVQWLQTQAFIQAYDWENTPVNAHQEIQMERAIGEGNLWILPVRGLRDDRGEVTRANIWQAFPFGCDWLTHCHDKGAYEALVARYCPY